MKTWEECKQSGSDHYKTGSVEPIDLYRAGGLLRGYAITSIIKYAYRNRSGALNHKDIEKIKHLCDLLIADNTQYYREYP